MCFENLQILYSSRELKFSKFNFFRPTTFKFRNIYQNHHLDEEFINSSFLVMNEISVHALASGGGRRAWRDAWVRGGVFSPRFQESAGSSPAGRRGPAGGPGESSAGVDCVPLRPSPRRGGGLRQDPWRETIIRFCKKNKSLHR